MNLLSFDIEISDVFDLQPYEDMDKYAPFHISVAATAIDGGEESLWYSEDGDDEPVLNITKEDAAEMLEYLRDMQQSGYMVCAWNGLSFDLRWIGHAAGNKSLAAQIALDSYDPMFQFFNEKGFPVSLAKVGGAMGINQQKLMDAADAPKQWRAGNHQTVMDYVLGDCQITNQIVKAIISRGEVLWITQAGKSRACVMPELKTVNAVLKDPEPDQSWMDSPLPREKFCGWLFD